jgi:hypothetical protein
MGLKQSGFGHATPSSSYNKKPALELRLKLAELKSSSFNIAATLQCGHTQDISSILQIKLFDESKNHLTPMSIRKSHSEQLCLTNQPKITGFNLR